MHLEPPRSKLARFYGSQRAMLQPEAVVLINDGPEAAGKTGEQKGAEKQKEIKRKTKKKKGGSEREGER